MDIGDTTLRVLLAILLTLMPAIAWGQTTTIGDLPDATSVAATDDFACDQGASTKACTALQIATYILTLVDTEAELEAVLTDVTNLLTSGDEDFVTAAMLANGDWGDVTVSSNSVNLDTGVVGTIEIEADAVGTSDLNDASDTANMGDIVAVSSVSAGYFEYLTPSAGTDITADLEEEAHATEHSDGGADEIVVTNLASACTDAQVLGGNGSGGVECQTDAGGAASESALETQLADVTNVVTDNDSTITFDAGIAIATSSNGDIDLSPNGTGEINANAPLNTAASANPTVAWQDSDATAGDDNVTAAVNCTDAGDGTEDCDLTIQQQIAGTPTDLFVANADGAGDARIVLPNESVGPDEIVGASGKTDGYFLQYESTGNTLQWAVGSGGAFDDSSDPVVMNTTTKDVHFGDAAGTLAGKVEIGGDADQPQLVIEGHSTQTDSILVVQNDADTEVFTVDADGTTTIAGSTSTITGSGTYVEIDDVLLITAAATPPIACTTNAGIIYHDSSGVICICDGSSAWVEVVDYTTTGTCE